jgi:hypothetical protein
MAVVSEAKMTALLEEVQKILDPLRSKDAGAAKVAKEVAKMIEGPELRGFRVVRRYKVKFTAGQLMLADGKGPKDRRAAVVKINSSLAKLMNAECEPGEITTTMMTVLDSLKSVEAKNKDSEALIKKAVEIYARDWKTS